MSLVNLEKYGITGTTEIVYNPSKPAFVSSSKSTS